MATVTIRDIARICGVGVSTVSRTINNHPDVNPETRDKILKVIEEYNYIPNNSARNLRKTNSNAIAVLVKGINNPFFAPLIRTMEKEINKRQCVMLIHQVDPRADEVDAALELVTEKNLLGILFLGGKFTHNNEKLSQIPVPFVMCTTKASGEEGGSFSSVCIDDKAESFKAVDYLCSLGHRDIAIIIPEDDESIGHVRYEGYEMALKKHQVPIRPELTCTFHSKIEEYTYDNGYRCMKRLLENKIPFTAVFAISDVLAVGACRAIQEAGKRIPEDVSVLGFDGIELTRFFNPPITTMAQPVRDIALESIRVLMNMIEEEEPLHEESKIYPCELIIRESCKKI